MPRLPRRLCVLAGSVPLAVLLLLGSGCGPEPKKNAASPTEVESLPPASEAVPPTIEATPSHRPATSHASKKHTASSTSPRARTSTPAPKTSSTGRDRTRHTTAAKKTATSARTTSGSGSQESFDRALVDEVNELRATKGLRPVTVSPTLERQAEACSERNVDEDELRHCGYENLYSTTADHVDPETVVAAWAKSRPHRAAMLSPTAVYAGGGIESNGTKTVVALRLGLTGTGLA